MIISVIAIKSVLVCLFKQYNSAVAINLYGMCLNLIKVDKVADTDIVLES